MLTTEASPTGLQALQALIGKGTPPENASAEALAVAVNTRTTSTAAIEYVDELDAEAAQRLVREAAAFKIADATVASTWLRKRAAGR